MADLSVTVGVDAPPAQVWAALTDWDRQGDWMLATTVRATMGQGRQVGAEVQAFTGIARIGFLDRMRITRWEPPHVCEVMHFGRLVRGPGAFTVRETGSGSRVIWAEELELPLGRVGRLGWPLVRPAARWGLQRSLHRFARWARDYPATSD